MKKIKVEKQAKTRKGYYLRDDVIKIIEKIQKESECSGARVIEELVLAYDGGKG